MSWWIYILIVLAVIGVGVLVCFWYRKRLDSEERRLVRFLKREGGEGDPRFLKLKMGVSRAWLESVAKRLEEKGRVVRWGWRAKSLICLKGSVVKSEKRVVKLLKANGGMMGQLEAGRALGYDRESFGWRMVRKLEEKGVLWVRVEGKKNFLVLTKPKNRGVGVRGVGVRGVGVSDGEGSSEVGSRRSVVGEKLDKSELRMVKILRKSGGEMLDLSLALRVRGAKSVIASLIKKGVVFRWGAKKRNVCLKDMLSKDEERLIRIVKDNGGRMMWPKLVKKMGYSGKGFHRVLDKLEEKGFIFRRKVGRSLEVVV